ncbi:MAG: enoyl-CoA hydratase/isomerase family protein [Ruminococcus flavefaciens]|nr:enoyl-CoA hydratase/isomerase family protein [Ruminococcus flavefaciens]MCM1232618.1 enoyl-CoA hydratase/isomerase family protein [Ruminococcus flavefaciens]
MEYNKDWFSVEINNNIVIFTMNAPENNLMTADFLTNYEAVAEETILRFKDDETIKGMIIHGGGRHFSVGADVSALTERSASELSAMQDGEIVIPETHIRQKKLVTSWQKMPFPVVAAIGGFCIGSGSEIAAACHFRICEKNARVGQPESTFGILSALGGIADTIKICGVKNAIKMVYSGELLTAVEAYGLNWADMVTDKKKSFGEAVKLIEFIATLGEHFDPSEKPRYLAEFLNERNSCNE